MQFENIKSIAIIGSGTMGLGIANVFALKGYSTILFDIQQNAIDKAKAAITKNLDGALKRGKINEDQKNEALNCITFTTDFAALKADFILEAIIEKLEVKVELFNKLAEQNSAETIFATNTSTIPITKIGAAIPNPERLVGVHFFNPAHIMKLVEIISGVATEPKIAEAAFKLVTYLGKTAVNAADSPGFIVNRVARHFYVEGLKVLEENVTDHEGIDKLMQASGFKMGPFQLMDLIGVDTNFAVTSSMYETFHYDSKFRPNRIQEQKVFAGHHGRKSGQGFYKYES